MAKRYMSKNSKSKYRNFKVSPLIPIVAIIEVVLLLVVCVYAWFTASINRTLLSDVITVDPDSGLEIDFDNPSDDSIDINDYLKDFKFEPATSVDGRNIYFPTLGTFGNTKTGDMEFREGTINDINSKYLSIDFSLTNTGNKAIPVYLSSESYFRVKDSASSTEKSTSSALRFAFYQNDGTSGAVTSKLLHGYSDQVTIYFYNNVGWENVYAYCWKGTQSIADFPGVPAKHLSDNLYYFTFNTNTYDSIVFDDGTGRNVYTEPVDRYSLTQTADITINGTGDSTYQKLNNGYIYSVPTGNDYYFKDTYQDNKYKYKLSAKSYYDDYSDGTYPVISPGTSTGFQRGYSPVESIDNATGEPINIIPAFAGAFDDYLYKESDTTGEYSLFSLAPGEKSALTMIVWLEGTDPGCDASTYAGKLIDIYFKFATKNKGADQLYTYNLLDKTLAAWTSDQITDNGITFDTVIQMYDKTVGKGYLMKSTATTNVLADDGSSKAKTTKWSCDAPQTIVTGTDNIINGNPTPHDIVFRRVCPTDENLYWNYWEAGAFVNENGAISGDNVYFTALADSAPSSERFSENLPRACGGFWGNITTHKFVVYDADGVALGASSVDGKGSIVSLKYTYKSQSVEYKMDGPYNDGFYYANVPTDFRGNTTLHIKKYSGYSKGAFTSPTENPDLKIDSITRSDGNVLGYGTVSGWFYNVGGKALNDHDNCYYGSDILYIQNSATIDGLHQGAFLQVAYKQHNSDDRFYSYLYAKNAYKGSYNSSYVSIVPCDRQYYTYRLERCNQNDPSHSDKYEVSPVTTPGGSYTADITSTTSGSFIENNITNNKNIFTADYYYKRMFINIHHSIGYGVQAEIRATVSNEKDGDYVKGGVQYVMQGVHDGGSSGYDHYTLTFSTNNKYIQFDRYSSSGTWWDKTVALSTNPDTNGDGYTYNTADLKNVAYTSNFGPLYETGYDYLEKIGFMVNNADTDSYGMWLRGNHDWMTYTQKNKPMSN